jgi:hypothetical protein
MKKETNMFKITALTSIATTAFLSTAVLASQEAIDRFEADWQNPAYTQAKLVDMDINGVIKTYYTTSEPVQFTRTMLWDLERKKARDPKCYIPHVVSEGRSWGRVTLQEGDEQFFRSSQQRQWLTEAFAPVFEKVYLFNQKQKALFFGLSEIQDETGTILHATNSQPLFHVEHGVGGTEDAPLNTWRIIHLTQSKSDDLIKLFETFRNPTALPKYVEVYIEKDLNIKIQKNEDSSS